ncbi:phospholipase D precursor [Caedimonas varicaedens]|uniref:Phospholipase D n=1 Tax=Caedimonas varicaedens TaxID=1629334 RepID=A0A0K8MBS5_9PROT|nr:phospholipase D precursor [Caedimonas varicaedens]
MRSCKKFFLRFFRFRLNVLRGLLLILFLSTFPFPCDALPATPDLCCKTSPGALGWSVCFTPGCDCTQFVVQTLGTAQKSVYVQGYGFTSLPIAQALIQAKERGVMIQVILDRSQLHTQYSQLPSLVGAGIPVSIDLISGIAHNKVMIVDEWQVFTGSFNWTTNAQEKNAENLLLIKDATLAGFFLKNWQDRHSASQSIEQALEKAKR